MGLLGTIRAWMSRGTGGQAAEGDEEYPFPENPYVPVEVAGFMFKVVQHFGTTAFAFAILDPGTAFLAAVRLMTTTSHVALSHLDPVTADRAWSWEIARFAFYGFAHDTDPDGLYSTPRQLVWLYNDYQVPLFHEVAAFVDAAFDLDPEAALRVADSVRWHGPRAFPDEISRESDADKGNRIARALNAFVLLNLCATYGTQAAPEWIDVPDDSPILKGSDDDGEE